jgi:hypothetical protein
MGLIVSASAQDIRGQKPTNPASIGPEQAFRTGIASVKNEVDLWNSNGVIKFYRVDKEHWYMQVTKYPGVPQGGIWIQIKDDGTLERGYGW